MKKLVGNLIKKRVRRLAQPRILRLRASAMVNSQATDYSSSIANSSPSSVADVSSSTELARKRRIKGFHFEVGCKNHRKLPKAQPLNHSSIYAYFV